MVNQNNGRFSCEYCRSEAEHYLCHKHYLSLSIDKARSSFSQGQELAYSNIGTYFEQIIKTINDLIVQLNSLKIKGVKLKAIEL